MGNMSTYVAINYCSFTSDVTVPIIVQTDKLAAKYTATVSAKTRLTATEITESSLHKKGFLLLNYYRFGYQPYM